MTTKRLWLIALFPMSLACYLLAGIFWGSLTAIRAFNDEFEWEWHTDGWEERNV